MRALDQLKEDVKKSMEGELPSKPYATLTSMEKMGYTEYSRFSRKSMAPAGIGIVLEL